MFSGSTYANAWIKNRTGLSSGEWIIALKMVAVRALKGRSQDCNLCRYLIKKGELLRNIRHHEVRSLIANNIKKQNGLKVYEEVSCVSMENSLRRVDILAIKGNKSYIWIRQSDLKQVLIKLHK